MRLRCAGRRVRGHAVPRNKWAPLRGVCPPTWPRPSLGYLSPSFTEKAFDQLPLGALRSSTDLAPGSTYRGGWGSSLVGYTGVQWGMQRCSVVCWGARGVLGCHVQWGVLGCSLHWGTQGTVVCSGVYWGTRSRAGFPGGSDGEDSADNAGDPGWIPGAGRSPGGGHGNPLQYSCLENPLDRGAWRATVHGVGKSRTGLSDSRS